MNIINLRLRQATAALVSGTMLLAMLGFAPVAKADHVDIHMSGRAAMVLEQNGGDEIGLFTPDLGLHSTSATTLESNGSSSTDAYYGVRALSSVASPDVHWEITIDHATEVLASSDVAIVEVGTYDEDSGQVRSTPATYSVVETGGNLALRGDISGWSIAVGEDMTNVDKITFSPDAPIGIYTITRVLVDETTDSDFEQSFSFTIDLQPEAAGGDTTAPSAPVVLIAPTTSSTTPVSISGTAEADSVINITGGASATSTTTTVGGTWSAWVDLTLESTNNLNITATDAAGNVSSTTALAIAHSTGTTTPDTTAPSAPVVVSPTTPHSTSTSPIMISGTSEANSSIMVTGASSTATTTASGGGMWSLSVDLTPNAVNALVITATDASGNVSASTTLSVTHNTPTGATNTPVITLVGDATSTVFACNGFVEPGFSAVDSTGASIAATSTSNLDVGQIGTPQTVTYTATDSSGTVGTTTRTVVFRACSSGGGGGGGGGGSSVSSPIVAITPVATVIGGTVSSFPFPGQVLGAATFQFNQNLRVGMRGQDVIELQTRLTALGFYSGPITGYFGPLTKAGAVRFQAAHRLPQTGFVGPMTRALLNS